MRGLERAIAAGVREIAVFTAASETFNRQNINAGVDESIERFRPVVARAREERIRVRGYVSTAFGCPYEGEISPEAVREVVHKLLDLPVDEISIGDTIGVATPAGVYDVDRDALRLGRHARRARAALSRHARHGARQRLRGAGVRHHDLRLLRRRPRRLPLRARAPRATSRPRTSSTCSRASGSRPASPCQRSSRRRGFSPDALGRRPPGRYLAAVWEQDVEVPVVGTRAECRLRLHRPRSTYH